MIPIIIIVFLIVAALEIEVKPIEPKILLRSITPSADLPTLEPFMAKNLFVYYCLTKL